MRAMGIAPAMITSAAITWRVRLVGPAWSAHHFAKVAAEPGLDAEVRLAGDGVRVAHVDSLQGSERAVELREKAKAGARGPFLVSL